MNLTQANWRKSTFSGGNGNSCVEMAFLPDDTVAVRDTKDRALAAHRYATSEWRALLAGVRAGEFDRP